MSVRVTDNGAKLLVEVTTGAALFLRFLMDDVDKRAFPITPKKEGRLRESPLKQVLGLHGRMEWKKVYAAPQEAGVIRGRQVRNYTTPGTGPHYAEKAVTGAVLNAEGTMRKARLVT
jgi:hypothetical protein